MTPITAPAWVRDAIFYQIFPDRFARSAKVPKPGNLEAWDATPTLYGFKGGDLEGVTERLDYLADLGVNALYFTPVFASTANHRYHTHDYCQVDPMLGGNAALRRLLDAAHQRGMRVVLDGVFNHASRGFFQFNHTLENGSSSPYVDWFFFNREWLRSGKPLNAYATHPPTHVPPDGERAMMLYGYRAWWDIPALPKFNTSNPEVRDFIFRVAEHWVEFGIDGWRLDVPSEIDDDEFWREFRRRVKRINPEACLIGEIWGDARRWLGGDQFDGVMNYPLARECLAFCFGPRLNREQLDKSGYRDVQPIGAPAFAERLEALWHRYPRAAAECQMNLLGSHDTPRLINLGQGDVAGTKLAFLCLFAYPGSPCVYYGDEIGMPGNHDPENRRGFEWDKNLWNVELRSYVKALAAARGASVALRRGDFRARPLGAEAAILERELGAERVHIAINTATVPLPVAIQVGEARQVVDLLEPGFANSLNNGTLQRVLAPRSGLMIKTVR